MPGWTGAGYIIFNPDTGDGAYKISGGANGGFLLLVGFLFIALFLNVAVAVLIIGLLTETAATVVITLGAYSFYSAIRMSQRAFDECSETFTALAMSILFFSVALLEIIGDAISAVMSLIINKTLNNAFDTDNVPLNC